MPTDAPRVLGVDDWARRRGQTYGTILVDLERHRPIDLLPDRSAETFAAWLEMHPGVEIVSRDRGGAYAEGARLGAPKAVQVADRFHLLMNVGDVVERILSRKHTCIKEAASALNQAATPSSVSTENTTAAGSSGSRSITRSEQAKEARRARRLAIYEEVSLLRSQGVSQRTISRRLGLGRHTVRRFASTDVFPERAARPSRPTILSPYEPYLRERWTAGVQNARVLYNEIRDQGFTGSASLVRQFVARWRQAPGRSGPTPKRAAATARPATPPAPKPVKVLSPRQAKWLLLRETGRLQPDDLAYREQLLQASEEIREAQRLALDFWRIVRERDRTALHTWLSAAA